MCTGKTGKTLGFWIWPHCYDLYILDRGDITASYHIICSCTAPGVTFTQTIDLVVIEKTKHNVSQCGDVSAHLHKHVKACIDFFRCLQSFRSSILKTMRVNCETTKTRNWAKNIVCSGNKYVSLLLPPVFNQLWECQGFLETNMKQNGRNEKQEIRSCMNEYETAFLFVTCGFVLNNHQMYLCFGGCWYSYSGVYKCTLYWGQRYQHTTFCLLLFVAF